MNQVNVVEEMQVVVSKVAAKLGRPVYYMFGHPVEIVNRLQEMTNSPSEKDKKFPLVVLFTDIAIPRNQTIGFYGKAKLQIIIANYTEQNYDSPDRLANNFKPILQPIKEELLNQISRHKQFTFEEAVEFTEIERYFWGKQGLYGNTGNEFNDFIDCIELKDVSVTIKNNICSPTLSNHLN
jgi:hypothetical protein